MLTPKQARFRLAPTPSGYLHEGNLFNFAVTALLAQVLGGALRLRIDDLDSERKRSHYVEDVFRCLDAMGIQWEYGPKTPQEHEQAFTQSHRLGRYQELIQRLIQTGQLFACTCSRKELEAQALSSTLAASPCKCYTIGLLYTTPNAALRLKLSKEVTIQWQEMNGFSKEIALAEAIPFPIIRGKNGMPAYHIVSLADDLDYGITHIIRGEDLIASTALQVHLAQLLGEEAFLLVQFLHHPLMLSESGEKLSKSAGARSMPFQFGADGNERSPTTLFHRAERWLREVGLSD